MSETYKVIYDQEALEDFIDWLPDLQLDERFYVSLQVRQKYSSKLVECGELSQFTASKSNLLSKIKQLECPLGSYLTVDQEVVPQDSLVLYITPNPRSMERATYTGIALLMESLQQKYYEGELIFNPDMMVLKGIHKTEGRFAFAHFDIDKSIGDPQIRKQEADDLWGLVVGVVGRKATTIIETRGGWHILVNVSKVEAKSSDWYERLSEKLDYDGIGDIKMPVVGCCQGGYVPRFYKRAINSVG